MFQELFKYSHVVHRHMNNQFAAQRESYLRDRAENGCTAATLIKEASELLRIVCWLRIPAVGVTRRQIRSAASRFSGREDRRGKTHSQWSRTHFISVATRWCRYLGWLQEPDDLPEPFADYLSDFAQWLERERGLSSWTVHSYCWYAKDFVQWYIRTGADSLVRAQIRDVDAYLECRGAANWSRSSVSKSAHALRTFFRHAQRGGWCRQPIANAIQGPRLYTYEGLPTAPSWEEVRSAIAATATSKPRDVRDRAIIMLCAIYGLRSGEISALKIEHIDWEHNQILIWRPKQRCSQEYPLNSAVGNAIAQYLTTVRPRSTRREVFLTLRAPFRPIGQSSIYHAVSSRLKGLGSSAPHTGSHSLRHACGTHLVQQGFSLKEVGDHLGHRSCSSTRVYAKVDLPALREVAAIDMGGVL